MDGADMGVPLVGPLNPDELARQRVEVTGRLLELARDRFDLPGRPHVPEGAEVGVFYRPLVDPPIPRGHNLPYSSGSFSERVVGTQPRLKSPCSRRTRSGIPLTS